MTDPANVAELISGKAPQGTPSPTTPRTIGPKGGCFGVLSIVVVLSLALLVFCIFV
jgi:hypothetical protein